jgi:DNA-binding MarR family transcriptional regulator
MASFKNGSIALRDTLLWKCFSVNQKSIRVNPLGQDGGMLETFTSQPEFNFPKNKMPSKSPSQPPFVDGYLAALLGQASQLISAEFHQVVRSHGFSVTEWRVLASLFGSKGMSIGHLATISLTKQPTVTRLLDRMESLGHVRRTPQTKDRRVTHVVITPQGQKIVKSLIKQAKEHEEKILEPFGLAQAEALKLTLRQIIAQRHQSA